MKKSELPKGIAQSLGDWRSKAIKTIALIQSPQQKAAVMETFLEAAATSCGVSVDTVRETWKRFDAKPDAGVRERRKEIADSIEKALQTFFDACLASTSKRILEATAHLDQLTEAFINAYSVDGTPKYPGWSAWIAWTAQGVHPMTYSWDDGTGRIQKGVAPIPKPRTSGKHHNASDKMVSQ